MLAVSGAPEDAARPRPLLIERCRRLLLGTRFDPARNELAAALAAVRRDLRKAESESSTMKRSLGLAEQIAGVGHWRIELPDWQLSWSPEVYRIHGFDPASGPPLVAHALEAYMLEDRVVVEACVAKAIESGEGFEFNASLMRADGEIRHVLSRGIAEIGCDGAVKAVFGVFIDLTEQKKTEARLRRLHQEAEAANRLLSELASQDCLTGLANRRKFNAMLELELRRACRTGAPLALLMIDVDHFKSYNDIYGHPKGDDCLRAIAEVIGTCASRAGDLAARLGGEEFAVILSDTREEAAIKVASGILAGISALDFEHHRSYERRVTVSAGIAVQYPRMGDPASLLLEAADRALYRAKRSGRARQCVEPVQSLGTADAMVGMAGDD